MVADHIHESAKIKSSLRLSTPEDGPIGRHESKGRHLPSTRQSMNNKQGGPSGATTGPTAAAVAAAAQKQKVLMQRLDTEISNIVDNFIHLVSVSRVSEPSVRNSQDSFQMEVRAAKMTQAADLLLKLVSELKQTAMFSGFAALNENVERRIAVFDKEAESTERLLERIGEEAAASLKELETHYYSSAIKKLQDDQ